MTALLILCGITYILLSFVMGGLTLRRMVKNGFLIHPNKRSWHDDCAVMLEVVLCVLFWFIVLPFVLACDLKDYIEEKWSVDLRLVSLFFGKVK